ncbi:DUF4031 domain-containing protein [Nocardiopsis sp. L17-MgMaSL7]|uniref:DUF4031 domain-containing protein n=1 Tax=Nocardiopsis sp. L17-MgMaSL7 TaxID=1938893 RepID=UPI000D70F583|nr:DUF4031 domain-containing protein [Nocardiopsis sp. L17-MgMaSL7]PWV57868.1 uncharacterized protein DUF4031 [Nocardiopsis sp. L17-MgMaSL7]
MSVLIDSPVWPGPRGWRFAHLVSDSSFEELHTFARELGVPPGAFERDHYDVPEHLHARALEMGAERVSGRELVTRLRGAGLRRPKHAGSGQAPPRTHG